MSANPVIRIGYKAGISRVSSKWRIKKLGKMQILCIQNSECIDTYSDEEQYFSKWFHF